MCEGPAHCEWYPWAGGSRLNKKATRVSGGEQANEQCSSSFPMLPASSTYEPAQAFLSEELWLEPVS